MTDVRIASASKSRRIGVNGRGILYVSWILESWHQPVSDLVPVEDLEKEDL